MKMLPTFPTEIVFSKSRESLRRLSFTGSVASYGFYDMCLSVVDWC